MVLPTSPRGGGTIPANTGIGLRYQHHQAVLDVPPDVAFMEVHTENYMGGGSPTHDLRSGLPRYPMTLHGVGLSLGSAKGQDPVHLDHGSQIADRIDPALVSEHVVWSISGSNDLADLLPFPMTEETLAVVCRNVRSHKKGRANGRDSVGI